MRTTAKNALWALPIAALLLTSCSAQDPNNTNPTDTDNHSDAQHSEHAHIENAVAVSYDGGVLLLDGESLEVKATIEHPGFLRINNVADNSHLLLSDAENSFILLDAEHGKKTDVTFPGAKPGHVVNHDGKTVLFTDGTGEVRVIETEHIEDGAAKLYKSDAPHHGVAVATEDGGLVVTVSDRSGVVVLDANFKQVSDSGAVCPGIHGETAVGHTIAFGCNDGVLLYKDAEFTKLSSGSYGRIGNQFSSHGSDVILGDFRANPDDTVLYSVSLIDITDKTLKTVPLPDGDSYSFRSLARGPHGEIFVLGHSGKLYIMADPESAAFNDARQIVEAWKEPAEWQQPRPALFVRGHDVYVTEPAKKTVSVLDSHSFEVAATVTLEVIPNEITGVAASDHDHEAHEGHGHEHEGHDHEHEGHEGHDHEHEHEGHGGHGHDHNH